jgi:hypothetical protein
MRKVEVFRIWILVSFVNAFLFARVIDCDYSLSNWWSPLIDLRRDGLAVVIECRRLDDD